MAIQDIEKNLLDHLTDFSGTKVAFLLDNQVLTSLRDDIPTIPHPNMWDLPGGGREGNETPFECLRREVMEELSLTIQPTDIIWAKSYLSMLDQTKQSVFMVGKFSQEQFDSIILGDEGQAYKLMSVEDFLIDKQVIPQLQERLRGYFGSIE